MSTFFFSFFVNPENISRDRPPNGALRVGGGSPQMAGSFESVTLLKVISAALDIDAELYKKCDGRKKNTKGKSGEKQEQDVHFRWSAFSGSAPRGRPCRQAPSSAPSCGKVGKPFIAMRWSFHPTVSALLGPLGEIWKLHARFRRRSLMA